MSTIKKHKLLVPGPVSVKREFLDALSEDIKFHRSEEFCNLYKSVKDLALKAFRADKNHDIILLTTSGTMAIEASILSFISKDDEVLVVNNGHFASRIEKILATNGYRFESFNSPWDRQIDYHKLAELVKSSKPKFILSVALETSTGALNSTERIGQIAKENNSIFFVDAVSGFFAEDIDVKRDHIDICVTVSNKALEAPSGMAFIYFKKDLLKEKNGVPISLGLHNAYASSLKNQTPFTPNIPIFKSIEMALEHFNAETRPNRSKRYQTMSARVRETISNIGASYYLKDSESFSTAITSISLSISDAERIGQKMKDFGYIVWYKNYPEQPERDIAIFQISIMGDICSQELDEFLGEFVRVYEEY
jgi:2-aminoethylphosphonate-pyruvate transaminase